MMKNRKISEHNKEGWKKLEEVEKFDNTLSGEWVQRGPYIVNTSGKLEYGIFIGIDKRLTGIDEKGQPILQSI